MTKVSNPTIAIIADDLTSATDGAGAFLAKGYRPLVVRGPATHNTAAVISVDTDSRLSPREKAAQATLEAAAAFKTHGIIYKTIDSTLRGHIAAEIEAAFRGSGRKRLVIAPAFPDAGRTTVGGKQYVGGVPVSESLYANDPVHPARTSIISELLDPSMGSALIVDARDSGWNQSHPVVILDAVDQASLNRQVAVVGDPEEVMWVGSPGMGIALADRFPYASAQQRVDVPVATRVLIVAGSANPATHSQVQYLQGRGVPIIEDLGDAPKDARIICLRSPPTRRPDPGAIVDRLSTQAAESIGNRGFDALIATGGETMGRILQRLQAKDFILTRELEPGFALGFVDGANKQPIVLAMKAGGFGSPSTLFAAADLILERQA
jgi:uncharacterized protein YgbK (DUF1537 family)